MPQMGQTRHDCAPPRAEPQLRHRVVPSRELGTKLVVARPRDGAPVVLAPTAAAVWRLLDAWTTVGDIDSGLAETFPEVAATDRIEARVAILAALSDDDLLLERG